MPPPDDDAILDAAVESSRVQPGSENGGKQTANTPDGAEARAGGPADTAGVTASLSSVTGGAVSSAEPNAGYGPVGITTLVESTAGAGALGTRRDAASRRLPGVDMDERLGRVGLALVLAVLLWFYVVNLENPAQTTSFRDLTLDVRGAASNLKVISPLPTVDVTIQAPQNLMNNLSPADVHPYIDLSNLNEGVHEVPIVIETNDLPRESLTANVVPGQVQVQLQLQVTRVFSIGAEIEGTPPYGYKFDPPQVTPRSVAVTGSPDSIARINRVVVPVDINNQTSRVQGSRTPLAVDSEGRDVTGVTFEPATVQVLVPIETYLRTKSAGVLPSVVGQPAPGFRVALLTADPNHVQICCTEEVIGPVDDLNVLPVPITGTTSTIVTTTQLILPPGVDLLPLQSREITITVQVEELSSSLELSIAPTAQGIPSGFSAFISPDRVDVTLQGPFNRLQQVAAADVRLVANVSGLGAGAHRVTLQTIVPDGVTLQRISATEATVTLVAPTPVPPTATTQPSPTSTNEPTAAPTATQLVVAPASTATVTTAATTTRTPAASPTPSPQAPSPTADSPPGPDADGAPATPSPTESTGTGSADTLATPALP